ncbi:MAG: BTAD domain-containing putative transcriptional regulator, partial [bacterium]
RSLQATLDWSHHGLAETEKVLFRRLATFPGSFTLEAVESICTGEGLSQEEVLDLLSDLVDKSLIVGHTGGSGARYSMLETMRAYGQVHLRRSGESDLLRHRHRSWFQRFAERQGQEGSRTSWLDSLERELENFRGALTSSLEQNDVQSAHRLAVALAPLWCARHLTEGRHWLERIQARSSELPGEMKAESMLHLGLEAAKQGEHGLATALLEQSHDLFRERGDRHGGARATNALGITAMGRGHFQRAAGYFEDCLAVARQLGDDARAAGTLNNLGLVALKERDEGRATSLLEQGLALARDQGYMPVVAAALTNLGGVALRRGDHARARAQLEEGLTFFVNDGMRGGVAECLEGLATVAAAEGQEKRAARLMGSADALREAMGIAAEPGDSPFSEALTMMRQRATEAPLAAEYLAGRAMRLEDAVASALARPLVEAGPAVVGQMPSALSESRAALRVHSLGPIQVQRDGRVLVRSDWTYRKARELLVFLLTHSTRSKEQIGVALWPDISPTQLRDTFRITLYHLRRTLGRPDWILYTGDGYALNRSLDYWYDVEAFEGAAAEAARLIPRARAQAMAVLQEALALYRGPFVEDLSDGQWYLLRREQLGRAFLEALLLLGQLAFDQGSYDRAAEAYRRAIRLDGYLEAAHRQLMRCYQALGERAQALRHYEALVSRFRDELGISPDEETAALAARLRSGDHPPV